MLQLINGKPDNRIPATDRGLCYGDGLFETIAVVDGKLALWDRHIERLSQGCRVLGIQTPDETLLWNELNRLLVDVDRGVIKILLTRGSGGRGYRIPAAPEITRVLSLHPWPELPAGSHEQGTRVRLCSTRLGNNPQLAGIKHLNRLEQVLARSEWDDPNIVEGIVLDIRDCVIEATQSNLFVVSEGRLLTPDLSQCGIRGVVRQLVIESAEELGLEVSIRDVSLHEVQAADALFLTNSLYGLLPVRWFEAREYEIELIPQQFIQQISRRVFN